MKKLEKSEKELLEVINEKLTKIIALFAIHGKEIDIQIKILSNLGFQPHEIAKLLGLTANAVRLRKFKSNKSD